MSQPKTISNVCRASSAAIGCLRRRRVIVTAVIVPALLMTAVTAGPLDVVDPAAARFSHKPAAAARDAYAAALATIKTEGDIALKRAREVYAADLEQALAAARGANDWETEAKILAERIAVARPGFKPSTTTAADRTLPAAYVGEYRYFQVGSAEAPDWNQVIEVRADGTTFRRHSRTAGIWYVEGKTFYLRWPGPNTDKLPVTDKSPEVFEGVNSGQQTYRFTREH